MSGPHTTALVRVLGADAQLVSYGAMSKQALALPTGAHIFRGLVARGFWLSRWYAEHARPAREALLREVARLQVRRRRALARGRPALTVRLGQLRAPRCRVLEVEGGWSDEEAGRRVREALGPAGRGAGGEKILLRIQDPLV